MSLFSMAISSNSVMGEDLADMAGLEVVEASEDGIALIMLMDQAVRQHLTKTIVRCTAANGKPTCAAKDNDKVVRTAVKDKTAHAAVNKKVGPVAADKQAACEAKEMGCMATD